MDIHPTITEDIVRKEYEWHVQYQLKFFESWCNQHPTDIGTAKLLAKLRANKWPSEDFVGIDSLRDAINRVIGHIPNNPRK